MIQYLELKSTLEIGGSVNKDNLSNETTCQSKSDVLLK